METKSEVRKPVLETETFYATTLLEVHLAWITRLGHLSPSFASSPSHHSYNDDDHDEPISMPGKNCFKELMKCYSRLETMAIKNRNEK